MTTTYTVKYRLKNRLFWKKITKVKGDLISTNGDVPIRILVKENEEQYHIPLDGTEFFMSKNRFYIIQNNMEREAAQPLNIKK